MIIPKIFHQIYHPFPPRTGDAIPYELFKKEWINSWRECNPSWRYRLWSRETSRQLIATHYPWFLSTYDGYDAPIKRVDATKYFVLHHEGGVYVDLDFACLKNLEPLLDEHSLLVGYQTSPEDRELFATSAIGNAWLASTKGHTFWEGVFKAMLEHAGEPVFEATGPVLLTHEVRRYLSLHEDIAIAKKEYLYPIRWDDEAKKRYAYLTLAEARRTFPGAFAITFWTQSFVNPVT